MQRIPPTPREVLRRMFDQSESDQRAEIVVNGAAAGSWFVAGGNANHAWRETELILPAALTAGKSEITVEVRAASEAAWSEASYQTLSLLP